jgi:hypothetical protein
MAVNQKQTTDEHRSTRIRRSVFIRVYLWLFALFAVLCAFALSIITPPDNALYLPR